MSRIFILLILSLIFQSTYAQLDSVFVEKYYVSDANDAKDIQLINGKQLILEEGSVTYRVYVKMINGCRITKVYGDANHPLVISSTANFYNHVQGAIFGSLISNENLNYKTVGLDTWLTLGQATENHAGVLKTEDTDGSIMAGAHNSDGMLVNNISEAGIPLSLADGLDTSIVELQNWQNPVGLSKKDSTIFGSLKIGNQFYSNNASIYDLVGVKGIHPQNNKVLVGQFTTKGELSFKLNIVVVDAQNKAFKYVSDTVLGDFTNGNLFHRFLSYPREKICGCANPDYVEFNPLRDCDNADSCKRKIVFGCTDPLACNFDPNAMNVPSLCCYPGSCGDRDISIVCPNLSGFKKSTATLYPNPVGDLLTVEITSDNESENKLEIYNCYGRLVMVKTLGFGTSSSMIDLSGLDYGLHMARFFIGGHYESKTFIRTRN